METHNPHDPTAHGHVPVMRDRMVEIVGLGVRGADAPQQPIIVDGTLGAGGHTEAFLQAYPEAIVIGLDRDPNALAEARARLAGFEGRFFSYQTRFDHISDALEHYSQDPDFPVDIFKQGISGFLLDLGVSSMQLDQEERGFAYRTDAPLDMRMDPSTTLTAADILNTYDHGPLARVLKKYGDEKFSGKIASAVIREREKSPFTTSGRLVELLYATIPAAARRKGGHPAKRTFQALRIEVNAELESLEKVIPAAFGWLRTGGTGVFMSYQSLEDKIVKQQLRELSESKTPVDLPMELPGMEPDFEIITRGAERASEEEIAENSRSAPVRVRAARRIRPKNAQESQYPMAPHP